jgi:uncharacterized protein YdeI (YjbR/CyaY-like superfamily)
VKTDYDIFAFKDSAVWRRWLEENHDTVDGIWMRLYKKGSNLPSVTYAEALDEALCYGWIDGQKKSYDDKSFLQKFTPRRVNGMWSKRNIEHVARLTESKLMMPSGMAQVEQAQQDGRWAAAYDKPSDMVIPEEFMAELKKHPVAEKFFATLNKSNTYAIAWRLQTAKTENTRKRRQAKIIALLNSEQKLH